MLRNRADLYDVALFDLWANQHDTRQYVYRLTGDAPLYEAFAIDNGHLFGGPQRWMASTQVSRRAWHKETRGLLDQYAERRIVSFQKRIPALLNEVLKHVPRRWRVGDQSYLQEILLYRLRHLDELCSGNP